MKKHVLTLIAILYLTNSYCAIELPAPAQNLDEGNLKDFLDSEDQRKLLVQRLENLNPVDLAAAEELIDEVNRSSDLIDDLEKIRNSKKEELLCPLDDPRLDEIHADIQIIKTEGTRLFKKLISLVGGKNENGIWKFSE